MLILMLLSWILCLQPVCCQWQAAVIDLTSGSFPVESITEDRLLGTGTIISKNRILTAAHLFDDYARHQDQVGVVLGVQDLHQPCARWNLPGNCQKLATYKVHPNYQHRWKENDFGIIFLEDDIPLGLPWLDKVCLPYPEEHLEGRPGLITGWKINSLFGQPAQHLGEAVVHILSNKQCSEAYNHYILDPLSPSLFCAYDPERTTCQGNDGDGLVLGGSVLVGVASLGIGCSMETYTGLYANVAQLLEEPFLWDNVQGLCQKRVIEAM